MLKVELAKKYDCDVAIIGGGPGGSALAYILAENGIKVIVVEAEKYPRDKICGDVVSPIAISELAKMGITKWKDFAKQNEIKKVGLFINGDKVFIDLPNKDQNRLDARIIPRIELDNWIFETAQKKGAIYLENSRLVNYEILGSGVSIDLKQGETTKKISAKMIVGADGSNSTVARIFRGEKTSDTFKLLGLRAYYKNVNGPTDRVDIYYMKDNFPGIYWMFPAENNRANIGIVTIASTLPKNENHIKSLLKNHVAQNIDIKERIGKGEIEGKIEGWPLTFYNPQNSIINNRFLLVGDAAGLINPLSGDGIQYALLSARWASEVILNCVNQNDYSEKVLESYQIKIKDELAYDFALSNMLIQFARNRALTPLWIEIISVLIKRAKNDKAYADIIAGIFEGSYPSYKALTIEFILKSLLQGGVHIGELAANTIAKGPKEWSKSGTELSKIALNLIDSIKQNPKGNLQWLGVLIKNGILVGSYLVKNKAN